MKGPIRHLAFTLVVLVLAVGCRSMTGQSLGTNIDNKTMTANVKARLAADQLQNLTWVDVDSDAGTVFLHGTATTQAQKARATEIAQSVNGVKKVVNNIQVRSAAATAGTASTVSASPATGFQARHTTTGEITSVDAAHGQVNLKTPEGDMQLHFPPSALTNVHTGDHVTVDLGITPAR
jgi:hypothetical protein